MEKYQNKYRIKSARLPNWDYGWDGSYFVTICTHNRVNYFGDIDNGNMQFSNIGIIANILWYEIKNHSKNIELGAFVVMPNHIPGILALNGNVQTGHALSLQSPQSNNKTIGQNRFQNIGKNTLSSIIGGYKSAVTKHAHRLGFSFEWQCNYWEHIVRNEKEFNHISQYILDNPAKWENDKLNGGIGNQVMESTIEYNLEVWMI